MKLGHHGTRNVKGDFPAFAWSFGQNAYEAFNKAWDQALNSGILFGATKMRTQKKYPEMFDYLGWCSWEQFHTNYQ